MMYEPTIEISESFAQAPPDFADLRARVDAAIRSLEFTQAEVPVSAVDQAMARTAIVTNAADSEVLHNAGALVHVKMILSEYDKQIVHDTASLRNYITNKLIEDSAHPDPRVRLKALEMLGKISDVGLFTEKTEVTYRHRPTEELDRLLREKLMKTLNMDEVSPALEATQSEIIVPTGTIQEDAEDESANG